MSYVSPLIVAIPLWPRIQHRREHRSFSLVTTSVFLATFSQTGCRDGSAITSAGWTILSLAPAAPAAQRQRTRLRAESHFFYRGGTVPLAPFWGGKTSAGSPLLLGLLLGLQFAPRSPPQGRTQHRLRSKCLCRTTDRVLRQIILPQRCPRRAAPTAAATAIASHPPCGEIETLAPCVVGLKGETKICDSASIYRKRTSPSSRGLAVGSELTTNPKKWRELFAGSCLAVFNLSSLSRAAAHE